MIHLNVSQKGFVFIVVPLAIQVVVICLLVFFILQSDSEFKRQQSAHEILSSCDRLSKCIDEAVTSMTQYSLTNRPVYADLYKTNVKKAQSEMKKLSSSSENEGEAQNESQKAIASVKKKLKQGLDLLDYLNRRLEESGEARSEILGGHLAAQLKSIENGVEEELNVVRKLESERAAQSGMRLNEARNWLIATAATGVLAGIIVAFLLSNFFGKAISNKLKIMRDNTFRFARDEAPHPELGGNDEIAELDRAFHTLTSLIRSTQQKQRALVTNSSEIICSIQKQGSFEEVNPAVTETWGYDCDELIGSKLMEIVDQAERERMWKFLEDCTTSDTARKIESKVVDKAGSLRDVSFSCMWSKEQSSWYCVASDISERKQLERMKKDFVAMISHDLRAPLASIRMMLEMVASGVYGDLTEIGRSKLSRTDNSIQRLLSLLDQLLEVEKMEAGKVELERSEESIDDIAENAVREIVALAEAKGISTIVIPGGVRAMVDRDRLVRVVVNLLSNAVKYSPNGGTIETAVHDLDHSFQISVKDQGVGIPEEYQATIFERYEQIKEKSHRLKGGTGLGLAICKMIVEAHGGEIGVTSDGTGGSTFWFRIPKRAELN